jgi:hypothetical protein
VAALLLGGIFEESAHAGQLARCRRGAQPLSAPLGEECPEVRRCDAGQRRGIDAFASIGAEELDETMRGRRISPHRVHGAAPVMLEISSPLRGQRAGRVVD